MLSGARKSGNTEARSIMAREIGQPSGWDIETWDPRWAGSVGEARSKPSGSRCASHSSIEESGERHRLGPDPVDPGVEDLSDAGLDRCQSTAPAWSRCGTGGSRRPAGSRSRSANGSAWPHHAVIGFSSEPGGPCGRRGRRAIRAHRSDTCRYSRPPGRRRPSEIDRHHPTEWLMSQRTMAPTAWAIVREPARS